MSENIKLKRQLRVSQDARHALVLAENRNAIAFELRAMLDDRGWTQTQLAQQAGMKQSQISSYMHGYDKYSLGTLRKLGRAFDVALLVTYVPFDEFIDRFTSRSYVSLAIPEAKIALKDGPAIAPLEVHDTRSMAPIEIPVQQREHQALMFGATSDKVRNIAEYQSTRRTWKSVGRTSAPVEVARA